MNEKGYLDLILQLSESHISVNHCVSDYRSVKPFKCRSLAQCKDMHV